MKILLCDDDSVFLEKIERKVTEFGKKNNVKMQITLAGTVQELNKLDCSKYDVAFLDIDMGKITGLDIARRIREYRKDTIIVFITNYLEYAPEGYEVQAFRYLLKLSLDEKIENTLQEIITCYNEQHREVTFEINGESIDVPLKQIAYIEASHRIMMMHLIGAEKKTYQFYATMEALEKELSPVGFLRIQKSYLVNMDCIQRLQCDHTELKDGTTLRVSKKNYAEIKQKFLLWRGEHKWMI